MRDQDRARFYEALTQLHELYQKRISDHVLRLWFEVLKRFELSAITVAMTRHLNDSDAGQYLPKPADIVRQIEGSKSTRAMLAWTKVEKAIRGVGAWQSVVFDDRIIHCVVDDMGGWIGLCEVTDHELPFRAREFEKRYTGYVLNPPKEYPRKLIGLAEAKNGLNGFDSPEPVMVGDPQQAFLVFQNGGEKRIQFNRMGALAARSAAAIIDHPEPVRAEA